MKPIRIRTGVEQGRLLARSLAALALIAVAFAIDEWFSPSTPPFRGRWAGMIEGVFVLAGSPGLVVLWVLAALALVFAAKFVWRHTPKAPSDRWLC